MTRKEAERQTHQRMVLVSLGISVDDTESLRRISMTLHRWHKLECGTDDGCIERDEDDGKCYWSSRSNGHAAGRRYPTPDREYGALRRLAKIMAQYPTLQAYVQSDPRGCALYILRPGDAPEGKDADAYYSRGIAVR